MLWLWSKYKNQSLKKARLFFGRAFFIVEGGLDYVREYAGGYLWYGHL